MQTQTITNQHTQYKTPEPRRYKVVMHNDDVTTMDFVVMILTTIFQKDEINAERIMLKIHHEGKAVVGVYTKDIAESKTKKATSLARLNGFPLLITVENNE